MWLQTPRGCRSATAMFQRVECDAVLEHVPDAERVMREIERVLRPGGYAHVVTPFCHPFHEYPKDYRRFTPDGLAPWRGGLEVVASGWRTGPTATMLVFTLEYVKMLLPWRWWRVMSHGVLGWVLFPFRYLDLWMLGKAMRGGSGTIAMCGCEKAKSVWPRMNTNEREWDQEIRGRILVWVRKKGEKRLATDEHE